MSIRLIGVLGILAAVSAAPAQDVRRAAVKYVGVVDGTDVYVRSGDDTRYYPCTKLSRPATVRVVSESDEWVKILPPEGTFSVVDRRYVKPDADGESGTVTGNNVWVRAGGDLCDWTEASRYWAIQTRLNSGDRVRLLGRMGDLYRIAPPPGAYFHMSARYVKPAAETGGTAATTRPATRDAEDVIDVTVAATRPAPDDGGDAEAIVVRPTTRPTTDDGAETTATVYSTAREQFEAAEEALQAEYKRPPAGRNLEGLIERYQAIDVAPDSPLKPYVDYRIQYLRRAIQRRRSDEAAAELVRGTSESQQQYEMRRAALESERPSVKPPVVYAAEGVLERSAIFTGGAGQPRRYLVRDPATRKPVAYVQSRDAEPDLAPFVGNYVGVKGDAKYDKSLGVDIVEVDEIVAISGKVQLPSPPKPRVLPRPAAPPAAPETVAEPGDEATGEPAPVAESEAESDGTEEAEPAAAETAPGPEETAPTPGPTDDVEPAAAEGETPAEVEVIETTGPDETPDEPEPQPMPVPAEEQESAAPVQTPIETVIVQTEPETVEPEPAAPEAPIDTAESEALAPEAAPDSAATATVAGEPDPAVTTPEAPNNERAAVEEETPAATVAPVPERERAQSENDIGPTGPVVVEAAPPPVEPAPAPDVSERPAPPLVDDDAEEAILIVPIEEVEVVEDAGAPAAEMTEAPAEDAEPAADTNGGAEPAPVAAEDESPIRTVAVGEEPADETASVAPVPAEATPIVAVPDDADEGDSTAAGDPLPPTGLPMVDPDTQPTTDAVNEQEYD